MPEPDKGWGAFLETGPSDWEILQRDSLGLGRLELRGRWAPKALPGLSIAPGGEVEYRLAHEDTGGPVEGFAWRAAATLPDGAWHAEVDGIPAGGPYRLETRYSPKGNKLGEWSLRGDMRHFLGVGDIWLIAGQSNAAGYGRGAVLDPAEPGLHMLRHSGRWGIASHPLADATATSFPPVMENYLPGHSPFLHFARLLRRHLGYPIGLVPTALGGSALQEWEEGGALFENMRSMAARAGGRVKGMVWYQGESDAQAGRSETYLERFLRAAEAWRKVLGDPALPILTVQLGRYHSRNPGNEDLEWSRVREAQRQAALRGRGITVVPALDLPLDDSIHLSSASNLVLAARLADCALGAAYGRKVEYRPPDLIEARLEGDRAVFLRFGPVESRLDIHDFRAKPFSVSDEAGDVPVERVVYVNRDAARLTLGRKPRGKARVHCGYGEDPESLPLDVERQLPVLAFHDVEL